MSTERYLCENWPDEVDTAFLRCLSTVLYMWEWMADSIPDADDLESMATLSEQLRNHQCAPPMRVL